MRLTILLACCACAAQFHARADQPGEIMAGSADFSYDLVAHITTVLKPGSTLSEIPNLDGEIKGEANRVHRYILDRVHHTYFGYDVVHTYVGYDSCGSPESPPCPTSPELDAWYAAHRREREIAIRPLTVTPQPASGFAADPPWKFIPLPGYAPTRMMADGDTIALDLPLSPDTGQKIVDYIQISIKPDPPPADTTLVPRDFTSDDGPLALKFAVPVTFFINDQPHALGWHWHGSGSTMWLTLPGRGAYTLSLVPCEGYNFVKSGEILDHAILFQADGERYELRTSGPILGSGRAWNLYVLHDPSVDPKGPVLGFEDLKCGDSPHW